MSSLATLFLSFHRDFFLQVAIDKALLLNKQLASEYRDTLYTYYEIKSRLMGKLEHRLDAVARVKDTRQLIELQKRLHHALNFYFGVKSSLKRRKFIEKPPRSI